MLRRDGFVVQEKQSQSCVNSFRTFQFTDQRNLGTRVTWPVTAEEGLPRADFQIWNNLPLKPYKPPVSWVFGCAPLRG